MRIAVISDIHGDLDSLRRVLTAIDRAATEQIWCLGDIVGLGATAPAEVVDLVRDRCALALADAGPDGELSFEALRDAVADLVVKHRHHWDRDPDDPDEVAALTSAAPISCSPATSLAARDQPEGSGQRRSPRGFARQRSTPRGAGSEPRLHALAAAARRHHQPVRVRQPGVRLRRGPAPAARPQHLG